MSVFALRGPKRNSGACRQCYGIFLSNKKNYLDNPVKFYKKVQEQRESRDICLTLRCIEEESLKENFKEIEVAYNVDPNHPHGYDRVRKRKGEQSSITFMDVIDIVLCIQVGWQCSIRWNKRWPTRRITLMC